MLLFLVAQAQAFTLDSAAAIPVTEVPISVSVARRPEGRRLVVSGVGASRVLQVDGTEVGSFAPSVATWPYDVDADGFDDLLTCGDEGLDLLAWADAAPGTPSRLAATACTALIADHVGGVDGVAVASGGGVSLWFADGAGGFDGPTATDLAVSGTVRLAARDTILAAAGVGDATLGELGSLGVSNLAIGGTFADVVHASGSWLVALSDALVVRDLDGVDIALGAEPTRLLWADLDVDGMDELVVLEVGQVEVVAGDGSGIVQGALVGGGSSVAAVDVDGDGCLDLVIPDATRPQLDVLRTGHCPLSPDADGDGVSPADGDCNDADPSIYPGAPDGCNSVDDDCDGSIDEPGSPVLNSLDEVPEGDAFLAWASTDGCDPDLVWVWTDPSNALATCVVAEAEITCVALDDGDLALHAEALDPSGALIYTLDETLTIRNVDPSMTLPSFLADGELVMDVGDDYSGLFTGTDPGADTLTFLATGGPDFFQVSPTGSVVINALSPGDWEIRIAVEDEDGGETAVDIAFEVNGHAWDTNWDDSDTSPYDGDVGYSGCAEDPGEDDYGCSPTFGCGGGCCSGGGLAWIVIAGWGLRRRKGGG